jgi:hypothetical protein
MARKRRVRSQRQGSRERRLREGREGPEGHRRAGHRPQGQGRLARFDRRRRHLRAHDRRDDPRRGRARHLRPDRRRLGREVLGPGRGRGAVGHAAQRRGRHRRQALARSSARRSSATRARSRSSLRWASTRTTADAADRLLQVAKAVTNMADQDVAAYATKQLLNKSFAEARPLLEQLAEQERSPRASTSEAIAAAKQYEDNTRKLAYEAGQAKIVFANEWLPAINGVVEAMVRAQKEGGTLAAVIAGIQTTITGTDQYKNDKELVELTERKQIQDKIDELKRDRRHGDARCEGRRGPRHAQVLEEAARAGNAQLQTTLDLPARSSRSRRTPAASRKKTAWTTPPSTTSSRARRRRRPARADGVREELRRRWSPRRRPRAKNSPRPCG